MSNISWAIYFVGIAKNLKVSMLVISIILAFMISMATLIMSIEEVLDKYTKQLKLGFSLLITTTMLFIFIPDSKTLAAMLVAPSIVNNKEAQKLPDNVLKAINSRLKKIAKDD